MFNLEMGRVFIIPRREEQLLTSSYPSQPLLHTHPRGQASFYRAYFRNQALHFPLLPSSSLHSNFLPQQNSISAPVHLYAPTRPSLIAFSPNLSLLIPLITEKEMVSIVVKRPTRSTVHVTKLFDFIELVILKNVGNNK